jgi:hypothetical protein
VRDKKLGLSSSNRNLIVTIFFIVLLLWGPINPYGLIIRIAYLIILPILLWFCLGYFGNKWEADEAINDRLNRAIVAMIAGALFVGAYLSFTSNYHTECTQSTRTTDGTECVGDYRTVKGPDKAGVLIFVAFASIATWYAVSKRNDN